MPPDGWGGKVRRSRKVSGESRCSKITLTTYIVTLLSAILREEGWRAGGFLAVLGGVSFPAASSAPAERRVGFGVWCAGVFIKMWLPSSGGNAADLRHTNPGTAVANQPCDSARHLPPVRAGAAGSAGAGIASRHGDRQRGEEGRPILGGIRLPIQVPFADIGKSLHPNTI